MKSSYGHFKTFAWRGSIGIETILNKCFCPETNCFPNDEKTLKQNSTNDEQVKEIFLSTEKFVNSAETILAKAVVMYATDTEEQRKWKSSLLVGIEEERDEVIARYNVVLPDIVSTIAAIIILKLVCQICEKK